MKNESLRPSTYVPGTPTNTYLPPGHRPYPNNITHHHHFYSFCILKQKNYSIIQHTRTYTLQVIYNSLRYTRMMKLVVGWTMSCMLATAAFSPLTSRRRPRPRRKMMILPSSSAAFLEDYGFEQNHRPSLPDSEYNPILISDQSLQTIAIRLRSQYDEHFQDPRQPNENRFVWDPWFVRVGDGKAAGDDNVGTDNDDDDDNDKMMMMMMPGELEATRSQIQYSLKRIPASRLFATNDDDGDDDNNNDDLYETLIDDLTDLAASIGLTAMTPPWVSLYLEGDLQNFHTDAPHGPMAFVLSLSKEGDFSGGETILLNHQTVLDYWRGFNATKGLECGSIVR